MIKKVAVSVICTCMLYGAGADVPEEVRIVSQRLAHLRSVWSSSIDDAYVVGTNLFWDVSNMTNEVWRGMCVSNCLDALVALPHVSYANDMVAYTNRQVCGEKDIEALKCQYGMLRRGRSWFDGTAQDYVYDSAFTLAEVWKREADLQLRAYEKIAITNWSEYYKNAHIAYFTNQYNRTQWKSFYAALNGQYSANLVRSTHVHTLAYRVSQEATGFFGDPMRLYYRSVMPERQAYIRTRLAELLGNMPRWVEDERKFHQGQRLQK